LPFRARPRGFILKGADGLGVRARCFAELLNRQRGRRMAKKLKITQVRSSIGSQEKKHLFTMKSLGFKRNYRTLYKNDTPQIRGMLKKVQHLVIWENIDERDIPSPAAKTKGFTVLERGVGAGEEADTAGTVESGEISQGKAPGNESSS
jgi:large subunit ribosomal protein L30